MLQSIGGKAKAGAAPVREAAAGAAGDNVTALPARTAAPLSGAKPREADNDSMSVPVMGRIAAGVPISAIQQNSHSIAMPIEMFGQGEHYALEVKGDSMIEEGILDGDTVLIQRTDTASGGEIVVALIDDEEATLKRFRKAGKNMVSLEAANPAYETRTLEAHRVKVQGRLVGLMRRYH